MAKIDFSNHNAESEQALIALTLQDHKSFVDLCSPTDFYLGDHQLIWRSIQAMDSQGLAVDPVTISNVIFRDTGRDTFDYLAQLYGMTVPAAHAETYAVAIREHAYGRRAVDVAERMKTIASSPSPMESKRNALMALQDELEAAAPTAYEAVTLQQAMMAKADDMERMASGELVPIMTGFEDVDRITNGLLPGEMVVIAGRPAMGKTAFAVNIAENVALNHGLGTYVFSLEMRSQELGGREASSMGEINGRKLRTGNLSNREWERYAKAAAKAGEMPIWIDDRPALAVEEMRLTLKRHIRKYGEQNRIKLVIVDYLQIATTLAVKNSRYDMVTEISGALKRIAKEFDVSVIALSQLSRDLERRPDKRPITADLRESGALEQDADIILFIYRDEVYHEDTPMPGKAEIIVAKNRAGDTGMALLDFDGQFTKFKNQWENESNGHYVEIQ